MSRQLQLTVTCDKCGQCDEIDILDILVGIDRKWPVKWYKSDLWGEICEGCWEIEREMDES